MAPKQSARGLGGLAKWQGVGIPSALSVVFSWSATNVKGEDLGTTRAALHGLSRGRTSVFSFTRLKVK